MIRAEGSIIIQRPARQVLEFVMDLNRYREADTKITRVIEQPSLGTDQRQGRARYRGRLRGFPTPPQWQNVTLEPWTSLTLSTEPGQWTARFAEFSGGFACEKLGEETTNLTHFEQFDFLLPARWLVDSYLGQWMQNHLETVELPRLKSLIEGSPSPG